MPVGNKSKPRVVIDTNVIISGLNFTGKPREILELFRKGTLEVYLSPFILSEVEDVLKKDFSWGQQDIQEIIEELKGKAIVVEPNSRFLVIKEKEADNRILECAVEGKTQFIISGDKRHILPLKEFRGIKILNPEEFLRLVK